MYTEKYKNGKRFVGVGTVPIECWPVGMYGTGDLASLFKQVKFKRHSSADILNK